MGAVVNTGDARKLGEQIGYRIKSDQFDSAYDLLAPILRQKTPFPILERIGAKIGSESLGPVNLFLNQIASDKTMGGWVVIAGALKAQLDKDLSGAFSQARKFIRASDVWYGADIFGERIPGPGLISYWDAAIPLLSSWRQDPNRWVRRSIGVAVHFWAKRTRGESEFIPRTLTLLELLDSLFDDWEMDTAKGIGWGLKTLGKYYPDQLTAWLPEQLDRKYRAVVLNKAMTYLTIEQREGILDRARGEHVLKHRK
jgi:3-methyladenine DNA glycosylase AlkD